MTLNLMQQAQEQAAVCSVFANYRRVLILWALREGKMSVSDIAKTIDASMQNTSQHLRLMREKEILVSHRDGQTVYYRIAKNEITAKCALILAARRQQTQPM